MIHAGAHRVIASLAIATALGMAGLAATGQTAMAQQAPTPKAAGTFGDWTAYHYRTKKGPVCYIVSQPKSSEAFRGGRKLAKVNRDPAYFLVTNRPADKVRGEVNTIIGYRFKPNSTVKLEIDGNIFTLFTVDDGAWSEGPAADRKIVAAMKRGLTMKVHGTSARGTRTVDTYSLKGVTAALKKIDELCRK